MNVHPPLGINLGVRSVVLLGVGLPAPPANPPAGYVWIVDSDGVYLTDINGAFYIEAA